MLKDIRKAMEADIEKLKGFLDRAGLSYIGIEASTINKYLLLENAEGNLEASIGIEKIGDEGILRSLVITPKIVQEDILKLFQQTELLAIEHEIKELYLVTNKLSTIEFFQLLGFNAVNKEGIPETLKQSDYFTQSMELENTILMKKVIRTE